MFYKQYFKYIIPSMISFTLTGMYSIVDGYFIGQTVGDIGLAAVNIAWPAAALTYAIGTGLGMGGSVISSIERGKGKDEQARNTIGISFCLIIIAAIFVTVFMLCFADIIVGLLGAEGQVHDYSSIYLRILAIGSLAQIGGCGMIPIIRSLGKPLLAMGAMVFGGIMNIFLDWLFVMKFNMGVVGAAIATIAGEAAAALILIVFFIKKKNRIPLAYFKLKLAAVKDIIRIGVSPFGLSILPAVSILLINLQAVRLGGDTAVAAYAVISYVLSIIQLVIQGISEGSQPLLSYNFGAGNRALVSKTARLTFSINISMGILGAALLIIFSKNIAVLYNTGVETTQILLSAIPFFAAAMPLYGFSRTSADYLYAINRPYAASTMVYSEGLLLMPVLLMLLPVFFKLNGVWYASVTTQIILLVLGILLLTGRLNIRKKQ